MFIKFFSTNFTWANRVYNYGSKNSISQIILTAIILLIIYYKANKRHHFIIKWLFISQLLLLLLMLKSRASIIALPLITIILFVIDKRNTKTKKGIIFISFIILVLLSLNDSFYDVLVNNVLLGSRDVNNINDITSGRYSMLLSFPELFWENPLTGRGRYYIESFPLNALLENGIIGGIPLIVISIFPLIWALRNLNRESTISIILVLISSSYILNGLFEALAPFGPGVKNYMLWLLLGICIGWKRKGVM